ncbi:hypothetical protein L2E82_15005 [Cichorium intybus]|uniref:Uncharacterized protein n=1 Tax=Cichorium intybus TaxID=13427 RepID=A0ACB9F1Z8_CICIN|nr:hypothetical protein L2E82_15005 [Cichorium intybus]
MSRKPKPQLTQSLSFPSKPRNPDSMRASIDGHPGKQRATLSNGNATNPANKRASTGVKAKESNATNEERNVATIMGFAAEAPTRLTPPAATAFNDRIAADSILLSAVAIHLLNIN